MSEKYKQTLKCIREVLDGFNSDKNYTGHSNSQLSDGLQRIDNLLQEVDL